MGTRTIDRRWIFLAMGLLVVGLYASGQGGELPVNTYVQSYFDTIESLEPGSTVVLSADFDPASAAEIAPMYNATLHHLLRNDVRVISIATWPAAPPFSQSAFANIAPRYDKVYGVDWVELGFLPGDDVAMGKIGQSLKDAFPSDDRGTPISEIPMLQEEIGDGFDGIDLLITLSAGYPGVLEWIAQAGGRYNVPLLTGTTAVQTPDLFAFYPNQLRGFLGAATGATMYLQLVDPDGTARTGPPEDGPEDELSENQRRMLVQRWAHYLIIALILVGNVLFFGAGAIRWILGEAVLVTALWASVRFLSMAVWLTVPLFLAGTLLVTLLIARRRAS